MKADDPERGGRDPVVLVQEAELGVVREVLDGPVFRVVVPVTGNPADVTPPEALHRGVDVLGLIRVAVVVPVVRAPPEGTLLRGHAAAERQHELHDAARLEGPVREVAVIARSDKEHLQREERGAEQHVEARDAGPDRSEGKDMNENERRAREPVDALVGGALVAGQ